MKAELAATERKEVEGEPLRWAPDRGWMADTGSQPTDFVLLSLISRLLLVLAFTILNHS